MKTPLAILSSIALASSAHALSIQLDYTYDQTGFFASNTIARLTLEKAAADLSASLAPTTLSTVPASNFTGTNGSTTAAIDWDLLFSNPTTGADVILDLFTAPQNVVTVYAGMSPLSGSTLGQGGPAGAAFEIGGSGTPSQWSGAVANVEANSNAVMSRGGGPIVNTFEGTLPFGSSSPGYTLYQGLIAGALTFDNDSNNNDSPDNSATLDSYWHFDYSTPVVPGKNDFYSVAIHEFLHVLGIGSSESWDQRLSGNDWLGPEVIALTGSGAGIISPDLSHIAEGTTSISLVTGLPQEAAVDPTITTGTRKYLTQLDLAFLRDLGYATIPEPSSLALIIITLGLLVTLTPRRRT